MHYYAGKARLDRKSLAAFIMGTNAPPKRRQIYADRALGKTTPYQRASGAGAAYLKHLMEGELPEPKTKQDAANIARALIGLEKEPDVPLADLLSLISDCLKILFAKKPAWVTVARKAVARIDDLYFAKAPTSA